jgi:Fe-Mn family superoxide dismutase
MATTTTTMMMMMMCLCLSTLLAGQGGVSADGHLSMCLYEPCQVEQDYTVPDLPYPYDSLEPSIDNQTMTFHHDRHFAGYTKKMNAALAEMDGADGNATVEEMMANLLTASGSEGDDDPTTTGFRRNGGGYLNHKMYFITMGPDGQREPTADSPLAQAISSSFGNFSQFQDEMSGAAKTVFGSGWAFLVFDPVTGSLSVIQRPNQDSPYMDGLIPLLGIDVWEHAYYLLRGPDRGDYISAWWDVVDFAPVEQAFDKITTA